jgi:hypothetical protein
MATISCHVFNIKIKNRGLRAASELGNGTTLFKENHLLIDS